jgi:hypothetical protein
VVVGMELPFCRYVFYGDKSLKGRYEAQYSVGEKTFLNSMVVMRGDGKYETLKNYFWIRKNRALLYGNYKYTSAFQNIEIRLTEAVCVWILWILWMPCKILNIVK